MSDLSIVKPIGTLSNDQRDKLVAEFRIAEEALFEVTNVLDEAGCYSDYWKKMTTTVHNALFEAETHSGRFA